jgi:hypothetical protein
MKMSKGNIYLHNEIIFSHKQNEILSLVTWMGLEDIMSSEITQTQKEKMHMMSPICGI